MEDELRERDREPTPTGEVRWQHAARAERKAMIDDGLIVARAKPGVWAADRRGRAAPAYRHVDLDLLAQRAPSIRSRSSPDQNLPGS